MNASEVQAEPPGVRTEGGDSVNRDKYQTVINLTLQSPGGLQQLIQSSGRIAQGFTALGNLAGKSDVAREALVGTRSRLEQTRTQIRRISECKEAHDILQQLDRSFRLLASELYDFGRLIGPEQARWRGLKGLCETVRGDVERAVRIGMDVSFAGETLEWRDMLRHALTDLGNGYEQRDLRLMDAGAQDIYDVLNTRITEMNTRMIEAVNSLGFPALMDSLRAVRERIEVNIGNLDTETAGEFNRFVDGLSALSGYADALLGLKAIHDAWQRLDDVLRNEQAQISRSGGTQRLRTKWDWLIAPKLIVLIASETDTLTRTELTNSADALVKSLSGEDAQEADLLLFDLRGVVLRRFSEVDYILRSICLRLREAGGPLDLVLENLR